MSFIFIVFFLFLKCSHTEEVKKKWTPPEGQIWKEVRVRLDTISNGNIDLTISKGYFIKGEQKEEFVSHLRIHSSFLRENEKLVIFPEDKKFIYKNREYRGNLELLNRFGNIYVINIISLEDYLLSVVPSEMPASWHKEALKAQAIAARTYALYHILNSTQADYHLEADVRSQMYTGVAKEHPYSTQAVMETKGMVLVYEDKLVQAFYHSNSGGITESSEELWGIKVNYAQPVFSVYCMDSERFYWEYSISAKQLEKIMNLNIGEIENIFIKATTLSGRIKTLTLLGSKGEREIEGKDFRFLLGPMHIKSLLFEVNKSENSFHFKGRGFGHGVGMSQWGSYNMAKDNKTYEEILKFYYSGVEIYQLNDF